jgi:hypothetical protein
MSEIEVLLQSVRCNIGLAVLLLTPIFIFCSFAPAQSQNESDNATSDENWISTWGCAPAFPIGQEMANQTLRQFVRISVGGKRVRIRGGLKELIARAQKSLKICVRESCGLIEPLHFVWPSRPLCA